MIRFVPLLLLLSSLLSAAGEAGLSGFAAAAAQAQKEKKVVYVLITTPDCSWCRQFKRKTLYDDEVKKRLNSLSVILETDRGSGEYPDTLEASRVPMHYFLAPDGTILVKMPGYWGIQDFMSILDDVERKRK